MDRSRSTEWFLTRPSMNATNGPCPSGSARNGPAARPREFRRWTRLGLAAKARSVGRVSSSSSLTGPIPLCHGKRFRHEFGPETNHPSAFWLASPHQIQRRAPLKPMCYAQKNGLFSFSSATVVSGPCPGQISVSGGKVRICSRTAWRATSQD